MSHYCPATGLKVFTRPEWIDQKVSDTFIASFWILGNSIIYSLPKGRADLEGVKNSIVLKAEIAEHVSGGNGSYVQIQDYAALAGSSRAARAYFINNANEDQRLLSMIFCNLSPPLAIAVKIGNRFNAARKIIHITKHYSDAVEKALTLCEPQNLTSEEAGINIKDCFDQTNVSLSPIELLFKDALDIITPEYSNRAVIIDQCILHSTSIGCLESTHIPLIDRMRHRCHSVMQEDARIKYIVINSSKFATGSRSARAEYMQSLKNWHQQFPISMYIVYGANTFVRTALYLYRTLLPFKVRLAKNMKHAFSLIHEARSKDGSKKKPKQPNDKLISVHQKDFDQLIAFIGGLNWEIEGIDNQIGVAEDHPLYILFQSIKLVKEELDDLFKERDQLEEQLRQSQKMEAIGTLAGGIAHDFNNILSSVIGFTELALDEVDNNSGLEDNLQEVFTAGKRARDLVKQILAYARQSDETVKPIQISPIVKEVLRFIRSSIPTTIVIEQQFDSDSFIMGNQTQVHQILMNLCTNAAQAIEDRGTLNVYLKDTFIGNTSPAAKAGLKTGEYIEIRVSDTGIGISPENLRSIFEPYFTSKGPGQGTGMGLAMVQGIVESYGGKILVKSAVGQGSTFTVYLPIVSKRKAGRSDNSDALPTGSERILLVDDEVSVAKMNCQILSRLGYTVTKITDSAAALALFKTKPRYFDLVITDMTMPNMTGDQLAMEIKKIRPDIPIILCTGYSKKILNESPSKFGISAIALKPIIKTDLARLVRKIIDDAQGYFQQ